MPRIPSRGSRAFSKYDAMDDEALRSFLRSDASKPEAEAAGTEELLYVMELLEKRRKERGEARDAQKAFEEFKRYYDPRNAAAQKPPVHAKVPAPPPKTGTAFRWNRKLTNAAAVIALLAGCTLSVGAARFDLWELLVKFTRETLYIETDDGGEPARITDSAKQFPYSDFPEVLRQHGISGAMIPTWLPEGFAFADRRISETPRSRMFYEYYANRDKSLTLEIVENSLEPPAYFEQLGSEVEVYRKNNYIFYIFQNETQYQAACIDGAVQCIFWGDLTHEEIVQMIESIKKV